MVRTHRRNPARCDCGYDLSGLAGPHGTRCPECGLLFSEITRPRRWYTRLWVLTVAALAPAELAVLGLLAATAVPLDLNGLDFIFFYLPLTATVTFMYASIPACVVLGSIYSERAPFRSGALLAALSLMTSGIVNILTLWLVVMFRLKIL